jgi:16S rRNA processing protein RimM
MPRKTEAEKQAPMGPRVPPLARDRKLVPLAEIARPHGIAGELRLKVYNLDSDLLLRRPPVLLRLPDGTERQATLSAAREVDKALLVRVSGVDDRNAAEALRGAEVCVPRALLPPPAEGEFYAWDLEGAQAVLTSGEPVGRETEGGKRIEVPLVEAYVARVDADRGVVELVTVDGLD